MAKQSAVVEVIEAVCCPSVLAAPLGAEEAADMAQGFERVGRPGTAPDPVHPGCRA